MDKPAEVKTGYPAQLRTLLGARYSCQNCEMQFELKELKPNGKKSRTWDLGLASWGRKEPHGCEIFVVKCPSCNNPAQIIVISLSQALGKVGTEPSPKANGAPPPPKEELKK